MKTVSIGRGEGCNIVVDDEMMSRSHAIIRIPTFGKMEVVDMSKNGTYVNGVRLRPNVPFPVTRKDVVNFADVYQLDWKNVPDPLKYYKLGAILVGGLIILLIIILLVMSLFKGQSEQPAPSTQPVENTLTIPQKESVERPNQTPEPQEQQQEESDAGTTSPSAPTDASTNQKDEVIDVIEYARASKKKREAEERARQQKAKAQQKAKEQQQSKPQDSQPSKDKSSNGNKNKTVVI